MTDAEGPNTPETTAPEVGAAGGGEAYRVLARKYRPTDFAGLIGQEAMVRTLTNAIEQNRLAHAFIMTGVRGVGKTSTARIIARALNCIGPDGQGGPTVSPCGVCDPCKAIAADRHMDVIEMDAASRTKVDEMRELLDGVRFRPTSARFKIYIIDEVHMLSTHSFNALLKTLEEPPEHVKFIFATTEIRKVPVTVLSRCQRFDLRRVDADTLEAHFKGIAEKEAADITDGALALIARAADGSVRDGLSLLDQAISQSTGTVDDVQVRDMLGLADRTQTFDLLDCIFKGDIGAALERMDRQYHAGADPAQVLEDMLDLTHWITRAKITPDAVRDPGVPEAERTKGAEMAKALPMSALARAWQMLLKGLGEVRIAPSPEQAAEMVLIRLAHAANLPSPADAIEAIKNGQVAAPQASARSAPQPSGNGGGNGGNMGGGHAQAASPTVQGTSVAAPAGGGDQPRARVSGGGAVGGEVPKADPRTFEAVVALAQEQRELLLHANLLSNVRIVRFEPGRIEFAPTAEAPPTLAGDLANFLNKNTARRWGVSISNAGDGAATLHEQAEAALEAERQEAARDPLVAKVLEAFPGSTVEKVEQTLPEVADAPEADGETEGED